MFIQHIQHGITRINGQTLVVIFSNPLIAHNLCLFNKSFGLSKHSGVRRLRVEAVIEEQRLCVSTPAIRITDAPNGNTNTALDGQAGRSDSGVLVGFGTGDIKLCNGAFGSRSADRCEGGSNLAGLVGLQVSLSTHTVNWYAGGNPLLDLLDEELGLGVIGAVFNGAI